jgi:hypothetical protein
LTRHRRAEQNLRRMQRAMKYDVYVERVQRISPWAGAIAGGMLGFAWGIVHIGVGAGIFFAACGAFAGMLLAAILGWLLVPHVMVLSLGVLAAAMLPFAVIWLIGLFWHAR